MAGKTAALRTLLAEEAFLHLPVAYDAIGGRLIEQTGSGPPMSAALSPAARAARPSRC